MMPCKNFCWNILYIGRILYCLEIGVIDRCNSDSVCSRIKWIILTDRLKQGDPK